jgi:hypothetical protein
MGDADIKKINEELGVFLDKCVQEAQILAKGKLTKEAAAWWKADYRGRFFYAIVFKEKKLKDVEKGFLETRLPDLVAKALHISGGDSITPDHAARASVLHNCPPGDRFEDWCN